MLSIIFDAFSDAAVPRVTTNHQQTALIHSLDTSVFISFWLSTESNFLSIRDSLYNLVLAITRAHASTRATSLMLVKNSTYHFCERKMKMKERTKTSNLTIDYFSLSFINLPLAWMLYFHVWLQNKEKFLVWSEYYSQFGIYQFSRVSHLEPRQSNLITPETNSELCQIS